MKRKIIIAVVATMVAAVVSTIAVRAELYSSRVTASVKPQSSLPERPAASSVLISYIGVHEEGSYLLIEGGVFFGLGLLWLKKARRDQFAGEVRSGGGTD